MRRYAPKKQKAERFADTALLSTLPKSRTYTKSTDQTSFVLGVSMIPGAGVGVFATHKIAKGTTLRLFPDEGSFISRALMNSRIRLEQLARFYGVSKPGGYWSSSDFGRMSVGWYMNHSTSPNVAYGEGWSWIALRNIEQGEEILCNYDGLCHESER